MKTEALDKRYPSLAFLLRMDETPLPLFALHEEEIEKEVSKATRRLKTENLEAIYIYGLGLGYYFFPFEKWLEEDKKRDLIFIEENLAVLRAFLEMPHAEKILNHPQVHIRMSIDVKRLDALAEECAETFPVSSIGVIALAAYKTRFRSRFYRLKDKLLRKTTMSYYMFCELQHYPRLVDNLIPNFHRMERSFDANGLRGEFKGIPAIICGAGPSLCNDIEVLRSLSDKALLFAGGSTISALGSHGIFPHFGVACDPNEEELVRFKTSSTLHFPLLYFARLYPEVFKTFNGPTGYIQSHTGGPVGCWMEEKLGLSSQLLLKGMTGEANSVTTSMVQLAYSYGCDPIIFLGTDLAFTEGKAYASGVTPSENPGMKVRKEDVRAAEKFLTRTDIYGKPVSTLTKWVMDQEAISSFAKKNRQTTFINATSGGLGFKRIPNTPLKDIPLTKSYDLSAKVHRAIETHPLPIPPGKVEEILSSLKESLIKAKEYVHIAIEELEKSKGKDPETGRFIFAQMEFEALDAYTTLLCTQDCSFTTLYNRDHRSTSFSQESPEDKWHFLDAKWRSYQTLIDTYLKLL